MRPPLALAVAQPPCVPYDVEANAAAHAALVRAAGARVVVFPELSLTGYELDAPVLATDEPRLAQLAEACAATGALALVGAPVGDAGRAYIGMLAVDATGARVVYRKMFTTETEAARFAAGDEPAVLDVDGWRLGLAVCRDTGVPAHAARTVALGVDCYLAGVLQAPDDAAVPEERARLVAATHRVWVATASFAGNSGSHYPRTAGGSGVWRPDGTPVARAGTEPGEVVRAILR
ncbi:carbon-nitrogen hydrolase family protein [Micromonospora sp. KC606]|uniref:carbon-nitrogen hydrolase family protein n=1 Tax=Micromonospora sp. KC606 TaxID=2530379 RepID=UPI00104599CB|nr:carbon-nitrogen hydrolase family protein [Micromonospora sp. KC606]TDC78626.1 carbon-nitrogen hydrolase family protein [Micromonospora sp. KC606]